MIYILCFNAAIRVLSWPSFLSPLESWVWSSPLVVASETLHCTMVSCLKYLCSKYCVLEYHPNERIPFGEHVCKWSLFFQKKRQTIYISISLSPQLMQGTGLSYLTGSEGFRTLLPVKERTLSFHGYRNLSSSIAAPVHATCLSSQAAKVHFIQYVSYETVPQSINIFRQKGPVLTCICPQVK